MIGCDCVVFGNQIKKSFDELKSDICEYRENGYIPEVSIFNREGVKTCVELNKLFPRQFCVGVYLNYADGMDANLTTISWLAKELKECLFVCYTIYDEITEEQVRTILACGGSIRTGLEDARVFLGERIVEQETVTKKIFGYFNK